MKKIAALALATLLLTPGALAVEHAAPPVQPEENPSPMYGPRYPPRRSCSPRAEAPPWSG